MKNHFIEPNKPHRPIGATEIALTMMLILLILVGLDYLGVIEISKSQGL